jgi:hydroxymethylglutaryl-CoA lyase
MYKPKIHDVGLRDGLQMEKTAVPFETKLRWVRALFDSGVDLIQLGSFVHPKLVPQMVDSDQLFREILSEKPRNVVLSGLVLNEKGLERGLACGVELFCMGVSASETHSLKNTRMATDKALLQIISMAQLAEEEGRSVQVSVQSAFGCGYEGPVPPEKVLSIVDAYLGAGLRNISLADTAGHADPKGVTALFNSIHRMDDRVETACHFHDTYGLGIANSMAALEAGVNYFEASFAGLGGCPFTAVAGGNVCTEDLVHLFQRMKLRPDIQLDPLVRLGGEVSEFFGRDLPGNVYKTGPIPSNPSNRPQD